MSKNLKKTPLHSTHVESGGHMVDFGGWHLPVRYSGDLKEHHAVREDVGLFDVSHMGEITVSGEGALPLLQYLTCNDVAAIDIKQAQYNALMSPEGGFLDDLLIYRTAPQTYLLIVNASNQDKDFEWIQQQNKFGADLSFDSLKYVQLALQGPKSVEVLSQLTDLPVADMAYYHFDEGIVNNVPCLVSRTGYTASDGYELYFAPEYAASLWSALIQAGKGYDIRPCGLGARDSLRIEGKMALYGNEINEKTTVLEAGLGWIVKLDKGDFIGKSVLEKQKSEGLSKKLIGFEMVDRGIARHGYPVLHQGEVVGEVTSGVRSPTLQKSIGMAYVPIQLAKVDQEFDVEIRGKQLKAKVVKTPFYKIKR